MKAVAGKLYISTLYLHGSYSHKDSVCGLFHDVVSNKLYSTDKRWMNEWIWKYSIKHEILWQLNTICT